MKKNMLSVVAVDGLPATLRAQSRPGVKVSGRAGDQAEIKPVENDEVFDHLFLYQYRGLKNLDKTAA